MGYATTVAVTSSALLLSGLLYSHAQTPSSEPPDANGSPDHAPAADKGKKARRRRKKGTRRRSAKPRSDPSSPGGTGEATVCPLPDALDFDHLRSNHRIYGWTDSTEFDGSGVRRNIRPDGFPKRDMAETPEVPKICGHSPVNLRENELERETHMGPPEALPVDALLHGDREEVGQTAITQCERPESPRFFAEDFPSLKETHKIKFASGQKISRDPEPKEPFDAFAHLLAVCAGITRNLEPNPPWLRPPPSPE